MDRLFELGISDNDIKNMLEQVPSIMDFSREEIDEKVEILKYVNCMFLLNPCCKSWTRAQIVKKIMPKIRYAFNRSKSFIFFVLSSAHLRLIFC